MSTLNQIKPETKTIKIDGRIYTAHHIMDAKVRHFYYKTELIHVSTIGSVTLYWVTRDRNLSRCPTWSAKYLDLLYAGTGFDLGAWANPFIEKKKNMRKYEFVTSIAVF